MKYESELIHEILEQRGHEVPDLHYQSECVESWIDETKGAYPKLCDYESEWLNYIVENPIGEFPYETVTTNSTATINNVVPYAYQSAILKGSTKYRDIDTGEFLETFEEGRNLELVSVKMPVLTTTGKNLLNPSSVELVVEYNNTAQTVTYDSVTDTYEFLCHNSSNQMIIELKNLYKVTSEKQVYVSGTYESDGATYKVDRSILVNDNVITIRIIHNWRPVTKANLKIMITDDNNAITTPYEPYKSNILTVNEDVTLRSNGSVYDELDLLTGKLTQRIDENGEVLSQEIVKTVDLSIVNQDGETLNKIKPIEGTMHIEVSGTPINPTAVLEAPVEAITQNLNSFILEE